MATSVLEQYNIAQFIEWFVSGQLILNPDFQRRAVWTPSARSALIDTILRRLPMPKVYLRTKIDLVSRKAYREVVDGQQRLRAIIDFSQDEIVLSKRTGEFAGLKYSKLEDQQQEQFLSYPIAVDQLINASDSDVLEVFSRLNSYTVSLNGQEKRHGKFSGPFRWAVHNTSMDWAARLWEKFNTVSTRGRLRMEDDQLIAEMFGVVIKGVTDGGQPFLDKLYKEFEYDFPDEEMATHRVNETLNFIVTEFGSSLPNTTLAYSPHFLMLFAACAHQLFSIPAGGLGAALPARETEGLTDPSMARANLATLDSILEEAEPPDSFTAFWLASHSSTQRISSRRQRFPVYYSALQPRPLVQ